MQQTGLLYVSPSPTDFIAGTDNSANYEVVLESGDWSKVAITDEEQAVPFVFDTMSCVTFSAHNSLELQAKIIKLPDTHITFLKDNGYFDVNGNLNLSDKFTAIMSGTTKAGNNFFSVADSIRKNGVIPESMLPFGGEKTWEDWHNKKQITQKMKDLGKEFTKYFDVSYEWVFFDMDKKFADADVDACEVALKQAPVQIGVPLPATHAIVMTKIKDGSYYRIYDSYEPFRGKKKWNQPVNYGFKLILKPKTTMTYKYFSQKEVDTFKLDPKLWAILDEMRGVAGVPFVITSGFRTPEQNKAAGGVANSAHLKGLAVDLAIKDNFALTDMLRGIATVREKYPIFLEIARKHLHIDIDSSIHALDQTIVQDDD